MYLRFFTSKKIGVPLCDALIFAPGIIRGKAAVFPISLKCVHFKNYFSQFAKLSRRACALSLVMISVPVSTSPYSSPFRIFTMVSTAL